MGFEGMACAQNKAGLKSALWTPVDGSDSLEPAQFISSRRSGTFLDLDAYVEHHSSSTTLQSKIHSAARSTPTSTWFWDHLVAPKSNLIDEPRTWQVFPQGLIYRSYLAGTKEPRFSAHVFNLQDQGGVFEGILGTRVGLLRFGTLDPFWPEGWQIDAEGAAHVRIDLPDGVDVQAVDFRAGLPLTFGRGPHRTKFAYYHLSSHLGDEFMLKNPGIQRLNYSRDVLVLGHSVYLLSNQLRLYAEAGWAFYSDVSEPWEFQFGIGFAPPGPTGVLGAPFWAINGQLRQEVNFGGAVTVEAGWAWRGSQKPAMLRTGFFYYNGESNQFSFSDEHEQQIGFGLWYDP